MKIFFKDIFKLKIKVPEMLESFNLYNAYKIWKKDYKKIISLPKITKFNEISDD